MGSADRAGQAERGQAVVAVACWAGVGEQAAGGMRSREAAQMHILPAPRPARSRKVGTVAREVRKVAGLAALWGMD